MRSIYYSVPRNILTDNMNNRPWDLRILNVIIRAGTSCLFFCTNIEYTFFALHYALRFRTRKCFCPVYHITILFVNNIEVEEIAIFQEYSQVI